MSALFPLFLSLWSLVAGQLAIHQLSGPVTFTDLYGSPREAEAALGCPDGKAELWLSPTVSWETLVHELAHAYDCIDDGEMNNSRSSRPATRPAWASDYCWSSDAEWYACSVVYYGSIQPAAVAPWGKPALARAATTAKAAAVRRVTPGAGPRPAPASGTATKSAPSR